VGGRQSSKVFSHCFLCRPLDFALSEDDGIEPRTVANFAFNAASYARDYFSGSHLRTSIGYRRYISFSSTTIVRKTHLANH
jgi:hypothetical protein